MRRVALKNSQVRASPYLKRVFNLQGKRTYVNVIEKNWIYITGVVMIYRIYTQLQPRVPLANG